MVATPCRSIAFESCHRSMWMLLAGKHAHIAAETAPSQGYREYIYDGNKYSEIHVLVAQQNNAGR